MGCELKRATPMGCGKPRTEGTPIQSSRLWAHSPHGRSITNTPNPRTSEMAWGVSLTNGVRMPAQHPAHRVYPWRARRAAEKTTGSLGS